MASVGIPVADGLLLWSAGRGFLDVGRFDDFQIAGFDVVLEADGVAYRCLFDGFGDGDASDMGEPLAVDEDHVKGAVYVVDGCVFVVGDDGGTVRGKLDVLDFDFGRHIFLQKKVIVDNFSRRTVYQRPFNTVPTPSMVGVGTELVR